MKYRSLIITISIIIITVTCKGQSYFYEPHYRSAQQFDVVGGLGVIGVPHIGFRYAIIEKLSLEFSIGLSLLDSINTICFMTNWYFTPQRSTTPMISMQLASSSGRRFMSNIVKQVIYLTTNVGLDICPEYTTRYYIRLGVLTVLSSNTEKKVTVNFDVGVSYPFN